MNVAIHAGRVVLGTLITSPEALDTLDLSADLFASPHQAALYRLLWAMRVEGQPIDMVTVPDRVRREGAARYGGLVEVVELVDVAVRGRTTLGTYVSTLRTEAARRRLREALQGALEQVEGGDPGDVLGRVVEALQPQQASASARPLLDLLVDGIEEAQRDREPGYPTGFRVLDGEIGGLEPGRLYVLAARPGMGKSAIAAQIAEYVTSTGTSALLHTLEMSGVQVAHRTLARHARVPLSKVRTGRWGDLGPLAEVCERVQACPAQLWVDDRSSLTIDQLEASIRLHAARNGVRVVVVDYLQLVDPGRRGSTRQEDVARMSRRLKSIAGSARVAILLLSQLSRAVENRDDKMPRLSDLRESGAIEQDADCVMMAMRPGYYDEGASQTTVLIRVAKCRYARSGATVTLAWCGQYVRADDPRAEGASW